MSDGTSAPAAQDLTLPELACRVRDAHTAVQKAAANALALAFDAGEALIVAQEKVSSNWTVWLRENCFFGASTARLYQQLARHRAEIEAERDRIPYLSLRAARRLIAKPKARGQNAEQSKATTLLSLWQRASDAERMALLDHVGVDGIRKAASLNFLRKLQERARVEKIDSNPNASITNLITKALSHIVAADSPATSDPVAMGNVNEALASLRAALKKISALGCSYHDVQIGISAAKAKRRAA